MVKSRMDKKGTGNSKRFPLVLPAALCAANGNNGNSLVGISNNNSKSAVNEQLNFMDVDKEIMNSTAIEESHPALQNGIEDISDIQVHVKCRGSTCKHCGKEFNNSNNMKQHLISIHKIFPPGMTVFKCPFKKCDFVSGNRVAFARHSHHLKG